MFLSTGRCGANTLITYLSSSPRQKDVRWKQLIWFWKYLLTELMRLSEDKYLKRVTNYCCRWWRMLSCKAGLTHVSFDKGPSISSVVQTYWTLLCQQAYAIISLFASPAHVVQSPKKKRQQNVRSFLDWFFVLCIPTLKMWTAQKMCEGHRILVASIKWNELT